MKITHTCTQVTAWSVRGDLSFFPLSSASSPCSACWPAQQLGWIGLARSGGVSLCSPYILPGEGRRGCAMPSPRCWCASGAQLCTCSICTPSCPVCSRSPTGKGPVKNSKPLKVGACSHCKAERTRKEICHIPKLFFSSILYSVATPAADYRVWINCLWAAKGHCTICVVFSGNRLPEWNIKCWVQNL